MNRQSRKHLEELIESSNRLCATLDKAIKDEQAFCDDIAQSLQVMKWNMQKYADDLKEIKQYCGV